MMVFINTLTMAFIAVNGSIYGGIFKGHVNQTILAVFVATRYIKGIQETIEWARTEALILQFTLY